ncbi:UDP-N-acetylmuramoyl-tripeptide--D-alanyl-D-alanine ligase [Marivivens aquimaris]|uniref:UDP-N-acetylmuramoyl-tripeptide--D-alanyl-D- alanine ligase n=1 Tax=Marivivens aquimaris TaxID=2774876 RepID=UPI00187E06B2|nr:UDP-N-acetylmuramoyl-tripeptide--D-alanyl-D-alanine ligase [Marivivens aquimaris]
MTDVLWTADDAAKATGGTSTADWQATGVSIDTRTLKPGDLFVALKAARDGHEFVSQALEKGAAAALVTHRPEGVAEDAPLLVVDDVLRGLEDLGRAARARTKARVVAVTGSVGKTSTKEMLRTALAPQGKTHAAEASYNNHWGVPLTLARMPADTRYAVIEIGMSNPGEIEPLARMARPHVAMVTTVAAVHLEAFENVEGIAIEKASIVKGLEANGVAVLNGDLDTSHILIDAAKEQGAKVVTFGQNAGNHHRMLDVRIREGHTVGCARAWRTPILIKVGTEGRHFAVNALGVVAAMSALGADRVRGLMDLAEWAPPAGRGMIEQIHLDTARSGEYFDLLDDAFNANPTSLSASLEVLASRQPRDGCGRKVRGRRVAILGDMLELGTDEAAMHARMADDPSMADVDVVHCAGPLMRHLFEALPEDQRGHYTKTAQDMLQDVSRLVDTGDVVLVKGSKGSKISLVVDALRKLGQRRTTTDHEG